MKKVFLMLFLTGMIYCSDKQEACLSNCMESDKYSCQLNCWSQKENCDQQEALPMNSVNFNYDEVVVNIRF